MNLGKKKEENLGIEWIELQTLNSESQKIGKTLLLNHTEEKTFDEKKKPDKEASISVLQKKQQERISKQQLPPSIADPNRRRNIKQKQSKLPTMKASCKKCGENQVISAIRRSFICSQCGEKSQCEPVYSIVVCFQCQKKVMYMRGMCRQVRCTNCKEINECKQSWIGEEDDSLEL